MQKEVIRVKEADFESLLIAKRERKNAANGGCFSIKHDFSTKEYVLVEDLEKHFPQIIVENATKINEVFGDFEEFLAKDADA